jgi:tRNA threonylcarbamoyladenosine biosynthesis protein TsaE
MLSFRYTLQEIREAARWLWQQLGHSPVVALHGQMGAGKTSLVSALCAEKGVTDPVGSPTFSIVNEYALRDGGRIYHLDLYRLEGEEEAMDAGIEDVLYSGDACFVEWPEKAPGILPPNTVHVALTVNEDGSRDLSVSTSISS